MRGRIVFGVALAVLCAALIGLRRSSNDVHHYPTWIDGRIPAVIWEPGPARRFGEPPPGDEKWPVVIACHGFSGSRGMMSHFGRSLARAGYAVIALDFRGHGGNPEPFRTGPGDHGLLDDIAAARVFAAGQRHFDASRIALLGHSMGAGAVLDEAQRDPAVSAVIAVSGARLPSGPYAPPNVLLIWARWDPAALRAAGRAAGAALAGSERIVAGRTYGDPERGSAVRVSEVDGVDHLTILYSAEAAERIRAWLGETLGPGARGAAPGDGDGRFGWSGLGLLALLVVLWQLPALLAPRVPIVAVHAEAAPLARLGWLALALLLGLGLLAGTDPGSSAGVLSFLPLVAARDLLAFLAATGLVLGAIALLRGQIRAEGLGQANTWLCSGLILALGYTAMASLLSPFADLFPAPHRLGDAALATVCALPYFAATEWWLRAPERGSTWACGVGRALTLIAIVLGVLAGLLPFIVLLGIAPIAGFFVLFEWIAGRLRRRAPNPWLAALVQAAWTGISLAAVFPHQG